MWASSEKKPYSFKILGWLKYNCSFIYIMNWFSNLFFLMLSFFIFFIANKDKVCLCIAWWTNPNLPSPKSFPIMKSSIRGLFPDPPIFLDVTDSFVGDLAKSFNKSEEDRYPWVGAFEWRGVFVFSFLCVVGKGIGFRRFGV